MYIYIYIYMYTYILYIYIYMYDFMYVCIYIYIHMSLHIGIHIQFLRRPLTIYHQHEAYEPPAGPGSQGRPRSSTTMRRRRPGGCVVYWRSMDYHRKTIGKP